MFGTKVRNIEGDGKRGMVQNYSKLWRQNYQELIHKIINKVKEISQVSKNQLHLFILNDWYIISFYDFWHCIYQFPAINL